MSLLSDFHFSDKRVYQEVAFDEWTARWRSLPERMGSEVFGLPSDDMRCATGMATIGLVLLMSGCRFVSRNEVLRVTSPDGRVDAIAFETDCGAPCSFGYEIRIAPKGSKGGEEVASLDAAIRNEHAWGVNLKWVDTDSVSVEYLRADYSTLLKQAVDVGGRMIKVSLNKGVEDQSAPSGGMLSNRH